MAAFYSVDVFRRAGNCAGWCTGLPFTEPHGAYYVLLDISSLGFPNDTEAAEWFVREIGVAGVPGSSFFREPEHHFIRFHFAKQIETLNAAGENLQRVRRRSEHITGGHFSGRGPKFAN